jgi:hypothetical protein
MVLRYRRDGLQSGSHPQADCSNGMSLSGVMKMTQKYAKFGGFAADTHPRFIHGAFSQTAVPSFPLQTSSTTSQPSRSFFYFSTAQP